MCKIATFVIMTVFCGIFFVSPEARSENIPPEARRHMDRGQAAVELSKSSADLEDAILEFEKAASLAPAWPDVFHDLGLAHEKNANYDKAILNLKHYLELLPGAVDAEEVRRLINKIEYRKEKAQREQMDPNNLVGVWAPDEDNGGGFDRFEIRRYQGKVVGGLLVDKFTEERGLGRTPWFVPVQWDGRSLIISHTRYFYCDKSIKKDCCPADASLSLTVIDKDTFKGTIQMLPSDLDRNRIKGYLVEERVWKRVK